MLHFLELWGHICHMMVRRWRRRRRPMRPRCLSIDNAPTADRSDDSLAIAVSLPSTALRLLLTLQRSLLSESCLLMLLGGRLVAWRA